MDFKSGFCHAIVIADQLRIGLQRKLTFRDFFWLHSVIHYIVVYRRTSQNIFYVSCQIFPRLLFKSNVPKWKTQKSFAWILLGT
jgi:hypothetical protein